MKLILLQPLSGAKTYEVGEEIEVTASEALRFIEKGIAKAKTVKAHNDLVAQAEKLRKEEALKQEKIVALQKEEELKGEADALLEELAAVASSLMTIDKNYGDVLVERLSSQLKEKEK